jgi:hypothetical protein
MLKSNPFYIPDVPRCKKFLPHTHVAAGNSNISRQRYQKYGLISITGARSITSTFDMISSPFGLVSIISALWKPIGVGRSGDVNVSQFDLKRLFTAWAGVSPKQFRQGSTY